MLFRRTNHRVDVSVMPFIMKFIARFPSLYLHLLIIIIIIGVILPIVIIVDERISFSFLCWKAKSIYSLLLVCNKRNVQVVRTCISSSKIEKQITLRFACISWKCRWREWNMLCRLFKRDTFLHKRNLEWKTLNALCNELAISGRFKSIWMQHIHI